MNAGERRGAPAFDRENCVHCGAWLWHCATSVPGDPERMNLEHAAWPAEDAE